MFLPAATHECIDESRVSASQLEQIKDEKPPLTEDYHLGLKNVRRTKGKLTIPANPFSGKVTIPANPLLRQSDYEKTRSFKMPMKIEKELLLTDLEKEQQVVKDVLIRVPFTSMIAAQEEDEEEEEEDEEEVGDEEEQFEEDEVGFEEGSPLTGHNKKSRAKHAHDFASMFETLQHIDQHVACTWLISTNTGFKIVGFVTIDRFKLLGAAQAMKLHVGCHARYSSLEAKSQTHYYSFELGVVFVGDFGIRVAGFRFCINSWVDFSTEDSQVFDQRFPKIWVLKMITWNTRFLLLVLVAISGSWWQVSGLGSMSSIAVSYGENGPVFCGLKSDGSHFVTCYGSDSAILYGTPDRISFTGLTAGNGFICGLLMESKQPYCWGSNIYIEMGVPQPMVEGASYSEISAGDHHLCGLRKPKKGRIHRNSSLVDCWGYNMTANHVFSGQIKSITAGSVFNCGLFSKNRTVSCWGDETSSKAISLIPRETRFQKISAGGYHVCGVLEGLNSRVFCWGRSLNLEQETSVAYSGEVNVFLVPDDPMVSIVGGRFHACGIKSSDRGVICWGGFHIKKSTQAPKGIKVYEIVAGDYFTCGVLAEKSLQPICWGLGFPSALPLAVSPGLCMSSPCSRGFYEFTHVNKPCKSPNSRVCLPCSNGCSVEMYQTVLCTLKADRQCEFNCSSCVSAECLSNCSSLKFPEKKNDSFWSLQMPIFVAELVFVVFLVCSVFLTAFLYVRYQLQKCQCSVTESKSRKNNGSFSSFEKENSRVRPYLDELKIRRAQMFTYEELERATGGFKEESQVGKGSFSCVFKGVLKDGTVVAVKKAIMSSDLKKNLREFHTELDLLSRLNHAHLLNLLGYCEEDGKRLLVYEFMANGSLHEHLHGKNQSLKSQFDWVRRVTIAVQAARGIEYLHGYACPPVIHRDIKSSNILIDEEHNARVADFGLSLLGPANSSSPLAELPAGTLGYLDPEYYRLHYLTTKSDVYSFGVLLLEILSGRKAIDMQFEEGNIVEWAVPLIKSGVISAILDPILKSPADLEAVRRIANVACKCVRMRGKERPSMDKVTTALERALALLMGSPCNEQPILPTEVVLGSSRMHKKSSQRYSNQSGSEVDVIEAEDQRTEFRAPSWITFPSVASSQRRKSSVSEADVEGKHSETRNPGNGGGDGLRCLEEEIGPASPQQNLFLQHNF
ncbi:hypothetical protein HHK36_020082 [Tetracentron sinense]|uniref:non-specific serine/threonine protein kinase n=1 Tax=Tetracentron sinense TaxID=13715 RepID=A0A834YR18_TETSI|nr:hypothetical protein HHK36_020082 [Tetracentron sinense]